MTLHHFNALCENKQRRLMLQKGVCVSDRTTDTFTVLLFQLESFYIEIYFNKECDEIIWIKGFDSVDGLEPYLESIDISEAFY